jgi:hypothetical protein
MAKPSAEPIRFKMRARRQRELAASSSAQRSEKVPEMIRSSAAAGQQHETSLRVSNGAAVRRGLDRVARAASAPRRGQMDRRRTERRGFSVDIGHEPNRPEPLFGPNRPEPL